MFHILPDDTATSAVWIAQRIPDDHIAVCANAFVIQEFDPADKANFMFSANIFDVATRAKLWSPTPDAPLMHFSKTYGQNYGTSAYMATRRVWRIFDLAAPSLKLSPYTDGWATFGAGVDGKEPYPFSVKPDKLLTLQDIMNMNRDQYEGTPFDLTKGTDSGPFGDPMRYNPVNSLQDPVDGVSRESFLHHGLGFHRAISIWRTAYSTITQSRAGLPNEIGAVTWVAQYAPHHSTFVPIYAAVDQVPSTLRTGTQCK
jgi:dipeptidase